MNIFRRLGRARGPRGAFYDFPRSRRWSYIDEWSEARLLPWYLRPLAWDWRGAAPGIAAGLALGLLVLGVVGLGYAIWKTDQPAPCAVVVYAQGSNITSYTETPHGCAVILPGTFGPG